MKPPARACALQSPLGGCPSLKDGGKCYPHLLVYNQVLTAAEPSPWETAGETGNVPAIRAQNAEAQALAPGVRGGSWEPHQEGRRANKDLCVPAPPRMPCSPTGPISGPQSTSGPSFAAVVPPTLPVLSFRALSRCYLFQEASLIPRPDLSASSGLLPGLCLCRYGPDHPVL